MADAARRWTDAELEALERRMRREYEQAAKEMRGKQAEWLEEFNREREQREKALDSTKEAMEAHKKWLQSQAARGDWLDGMATQLAQSAHQANVRAIDMVNDHIPRVFSENANRAAYSVDKMLRADTGFTLVNEEAVRYVMEAGVFDLQLIREVVPDAPELGPAAIQSLRKREVDYPKDMRWNRQKFTSAITQGILQGESIPNIVKRTESIYGQNRNAAIRAARTATTNAENAGRMNSFERAQKLGIDMEIEWEATLDGRTRSSHRELDGQRIQLGEHFESEHGPIRWPGDPQAHPAEVWCCRCRADGRVVGFDGKRGDWADEAGERWSRLPKGMTYEQWKAGKPVSRAESYGNEAGRVSGAWYAQRAAETAAAATGNGFAGIAEGQDILGTWQRRPDEFDFEIEDVMNAQGFDGKPRIVDADEFDRAVKQANGGDGLIMQRTYSAPDQTTLDAYRDMLYDGKWYVDCSTGGSQYGQGMYCAADYTGKLSDGVKAEMEHYIGLGEDRAVPQVMATKAKEIAEIVEGVTAEQVDAFLRFRVHGDGSAFGSVPFDKMTSLVDAYEKVEAEVRAAGAGFHYVETMTLDQSARVVTWRDAIRLQDEAVDRLIDQGMSPEQVRQMMPSDIGAFAASRGYDAINAEGHGQSGSYTVVLNRTKLIIRRP